MKLFEQKTPDDGVIRLEKWPEGYMLWYHGEVAWKSSPEKDIRTFEERRDDRLTPATASGT